MELAELYCKYMNGLEVYYTNYHLDEIDTLTHEERKGQINAPGVQWFQTTLKVEMNSEWSMRSLFRDNFPPHCVTQREKESKEKLAWFAWIPCDDILTG